MADQAPVGRHLAWGFGMLILGGLVGLFFVFRTLFSDGPGGLWHPEYLFAHSLNAAAYGVGCALIVRFAPAPWWPHAALLLLPGLVLGALAFLGDGNVGLALMTLAGVLIGTAAGSVVGLRWRPAASR